MINLLKRREFGPTRGWAGRMPRADSGKAVGAISCQGIACADAPRRVGARTHHGRSTGGWSVEQPQREEIGAALCGKSVTPAGTAAEAQADFHGLPASRRRMLQQH